VPDKEWLASIYYADTGGFERFYKQVGFLGLVGEGELGEEGGRAGGLGRGREEKGGGRGGVDGGEGGGRRVREVQGDNLQPQLCLEVAAGELAVFVSSNVMPQHMALADTTAHMFQDCIISTNSRNFSISAINVHDPGSAAASKNDTLSSD
jgi:hypothetical protein